MPGHSADASLEPSVGLEEAKAPLPYLRSRNALKVILDLDEQFGRPKLPAGTKFPNIAALSGGSKA